MCERDWMLFTPSGYDVLEEARREADRRFAQLLIGDATRAEPPGGAVVVRDTFNEAWRDAVVLGVGFYREPVEALASRDPGQDR